MLPSAFYRLSPSNRFVGNHVYNRIYAETLYVILYVGVVPARFLRLAGKQECCLGRGAGGFCAGRR